MNRKGPRIWPDSEFLQANADLLDDYFHKRGAFAELIRLGRWNERREENWRAQFVEKLRNYAAWLESRESVRASRQNVAQVAAAGAKRERRAREVSKIEALLSKCDGNLTLAIRRYLRSDDLDAIAACKARYYRQKKVLRSVR
jgi:hypothetical protein